MMNNKFLMMVVCLVFLANPVFATEHSEEYKEISNGNLFPVLSEDITVCNAHIFERHIPYILWEEGHDKPNNINDLKLEITSKNEDHYKIFCLRYFTKMYDEDGTGFTGENQNTIKEFFLNQKALPIFPVEDTMSVNEEKRSNRCIYSYVGKPTPESSIVIRFLLGLEK